MSILLNYKHILQGEYDIRTLPEDVLLSKAHKLYMSYAETCAFGSEATAETVREYCQVQLSYKKEYP